MVCGSKRYQAQVKYEGFVHNEMVTARTPAEARKAIRRKYGRTANILTVREQKGPSHIQI